MEPITLLDRSDLFKDIDPINKRKLASICLVKNIKKKENIFSEGDQGKAFFVLISGSVQIFNETEDGKEVVIKIIKPGEMFAEVILFEHPQYPVSAMAMVDSVIIQVPKDSILHLLEIPEFRNPFIAVLFKKMRYLTNQITQLIGNSVTERFKAFLLEQYGSITTIELKLTKKEIAAAINVTPETFSRLLLQLRTQGLISWDQKILTVHPSFWRYYPSIPF